MLDKYVCRKCHLPHITHNCQTQEVTEMESTLMFKWENKFCCNDDPEIKGKVHCFSSEKNRFYCCNNDLSKLMVNDLVIKDLATQRMQQQVCLFFLILNLFLTKSDFLSPPDIDVPGSFLLCSMKLPSYSMKFLSSLLKFPQCALKVQSCLLKVLLCFMKVPSCSMKFYSCSRKFPSCSGTFPSCSMKFPLCSIKFPSCFMKFPSCSIKLYNMLH